MEEERGVRIGRNEALFRVVNERIESLNETFATFTGTFEVVCECGDISCAAEIVISPNAYEDVRADSALFIVSPGHVAVLVERVIDKQPGYEVVRKREGKPQVQAERTDPRS